MPKHFTVQEKLNLMYSGVHDYRKYLPFLLVFLLPQRKTLFFENVKKSEVFFSQKKTKDQKILHFFLRFQKRVFFVVVNNTSKNGRYFL